MSRTAQVAALFVLLGCSVDRPHTTWKRYVAPEGPRQYAVCEGESACNGEMIFVQIGCTTCHSDERRDWGPDLAGLYGARVTLDGGHVAVIDEGYLRRAISDPPAEVRIEWVGGPNMPHYSFHDAQLDWLVAYLKTR